MSKRVIIVEMKDGKREGYVIEWGTQDSLRHFSTGDWMIFGKWKMIRTEDVKSLTLLPEEVNEDANYEAARKRFVESIKPKGFKDGGVIASEVEDEPIPTKPMKFIEKAMNNPEYKVQADKIMKESIDEVLNNRVDKANEKNDSDYGWDMDVMKALKERQDKEQEERQRPIREEAERKRRRKERDLNGIIKILDEVFWFIRKYNTTDIREMKKHNDLYVRIREELDKAHEEKYRDFRNESE